MIRTYFNIVRNQLWQHLISYNSFRNMNMCLLEQPCVKNAEAAIWYWELLDKLQKQICWTVGLSLIASLESLAHRRNADSLSLFYMYYFCRCSSKLAELVPLRYSLGGVLVLIDCWIFLSPFLDVTRMSMSTFSFLTQLDPGILCLLNAFLWSMI